MNSKLAGDFSLHNMIQNVINGTQNKLAADAAPDEKKEKKAPPFAKKEEKKDDKKEEGKDKKSSALPFETDEDMEKFASALADLGEKVASDSTFVGGESRQGGEVLPTMTQVSGKQTYKKDSSKSHNVPTKTPEKSTVDNPGAATAVETDDKPGPLLKYLKAKYPSKGVLKTAAEDKKPFPFAAKKDEKPEGKKEDKKDEKKDVKDEAKEKKSAALSFILDKVSSFGAQEKKMGGETLDSAAEQGPKPASGPSGGNNARSHISSAQAAINMKKVEGKAPQKKMLAEVLTEPALSKAHDSKVQENLRNASKGGVKIAAAKQLLQKIAEEGCTCEGKGACKYCKMKKAMEKKSTGGMTMGAGSMTSAPTPPMPTVGR